MKTGQILNFGIESNVVLTAWMFQLEDLDLASSSDLGSRLGLAVGTAILISKARNQSR